MLNNAIAGRLLMMGRVYGLVVVLLSLFTVYDYCVARGPQYHVCIRVTLEEGESDRKLDPNSDDRAPLMVEGGLSSIGGCLTITLTMHNLHGTSHNAHEGFTVVEMQEPGKGKENVNTCTLSLDPFIGNSCWLNHVNVDQNGKLEIKVQVWSSTYVDVKQNWKEIVQRRPVLLVETLRAVWVQPDLIIENDLINVDDPEGKNEQEVNQFSLLSLLEAKEKQSTVECDSTSSCRLQNVLYNNSTFYTFGNEHSPVCNMLCTTVHRKFIKHLNKHEFIRSDLSLEQGVYNVLEGYSSLNCEEKPVFLFNVPLPTYYYHVIADGALPLAHTILEYGKLNHSQNLSGILAPAQRWNRRSLPTFANEIFEALATTLGEHKFPSQQIRSFEERYGNGPIWFNKITIGFYPTIMKADDMFKAAKYLEDAIKKSDVDTKIQCESNLNKTSSLAKGEHETVLMILQRNGTNNENFPGAKRNHTTRMFVNIDEMVRIGEKYYDRVQVVHFHNGMKVANQVKIVGKADLLVSSFGSQWANVVFLKPHAVALMVQGFGLKEGCPHHVHAYRPVELLQDSCSIHMEKFDEQQILPSKHGPKPPFFFDEHCDHILYSFPSLVRQGQYFEMQTKSESFRAPFPLQHMYCTNDKSNNTDCVQLATSIQKRATTDPSWFWRYDWRNAHYFYLNQDLYVDIREFERIVSISRRIIG